MTDTLSLPNNKKDGFGLRTNSGTTLLEGLIVIAILSILITAGALFLTEFNKVPATASAENDSVDQARIILNSLEKDFQSRDKSISYTLTAGKSLVFINTSQSQILYETECETIPNRVGFSSNVLIDVASLGSTCITCSSGQQPFLRYEVSRFDGTVVSSMRYPPSGMRSQHSTYLAVSLCFTPVAGMPSGSADLTAELSIGFLGSKNNLRKARQNRLISSENTSNISIRK